MATIGNIPEKFKADIQSEAVKIFSTVRIDTESIESATAISDISITQKMYRFSTRSFTIGYAGIAQHYIPNLLSVSPTKESFDHENRRFKISNVSIKLSNNKMSIGDLDWDPVSYPMNFDLSRKRFSDFIKEISGPILEGIKETAS